MEGVEKGILLGRTDSVVEMVAGLFSVRSLNESYLVEKDHGGQAELCIHEKVRVFLSSRDEES